MARRRISYDGWIKKCEEELSKQSHGQVLGIDDIPDWRWTMAYEEKMNSRTAAQRALRAAMEAF